MQIVFLGTNGWYANSLGNTSSILIDSEDYYIILDAGDGIHKIDNIINDKKPIILLLSHLHLDHIIGLHTIAKFPFTQEINIYGYKGTKKRINQIISHPFSSPFANLPLKIQLHDIKEGSYDFGFPITCKLLFHADPCMGYRMKIENKVITYCTDTGVCPNLYELANSADVFITECSYKPGQDEWGWPHLKPEEAAEIALKSGVKRLILTHFDASTYKTLQDRKQAENKAKTIFENTTAATDDFEFVVD
ncbi:MAG: MBL fold metallo-hydrolase [Promethearchaeota archaeon]|jgi:ribonuclease BN (tRNA processing enzyme)